MLKKAILVVLAATAVAALGPAPASANWTLLGVPLGKGQDEILPLQGTAQFSNANGAVKCKDVETDLEMTGGTEAGHLLFLHANNPTGTCEVTGGLGASCGPKSVEKLDFAAEKTAAAQIVENAILITKVNLVIQLGSCLTLTLTDKGGLTATPNNRANIGFVQLAGQLQAGLFGTVTVGGQLFALLANYGFE
jgi:hypothetical protein